MTALIDWFDAYRRARRAEAELRDLKAAYDNTVAALRAEKERRESIKASLQDTLLRLDEATSDAARTEREQALFARIEQMEEYASQVEHERDDARREVDEVRAGLVFLEGQFFKGEGSEA